MRQLAEQDYSELGTALTVILAVLTIAALILWIAAIVSVLRTSRLTGGGKLLWIAVILAYPFLGSIGWFIAGRKARLIRTAAPNPVASEVHR